MLLSDLPREIIPWITNYLEDVGMNAFCHMISDLYSLLHRRHLTKSSSKSLLRGKNKGIKVAGRHLDPVPERFHTALRVAVDQGNARLVELLLKVDGINPNFRGDLQSAPLLLAVEKGHSDIVELLLAIDNIDPNVKDLQSATPLLHACTMGHISIVKQLLDRDDVDLNALGFNGSKTPLIAACHNQDAEMVNLLLAKDGINVNLHNIDGDTPLMIATKLGSVRVVESLLARDDLDPSIVNSRGDYVLEHSVFWGRDMVKLLLDRPNVDPNFVPGWGINRTALMQACIIGDPEVVQLFLDHKDVDINRQDHIGYTALCLATLYNRFDAARLLLDRDDIDANLPNYMGRTALFCACDKKLLSMVDLLIQNDDVDPNYRDNFGFTPLAWACLSNQVAIVRSLLSRCDTDPNPMNDNIGISLLSQVAKNITPRYGGEIESLLHDTNNIVVRIQRSRDRSSTRRSRQRSRRCATWHPRSYSRRPSRILALFLCSKISGRNGLDPHLLISA
jgi:ankyrin repeat protein